MADAGLLQAPAGNAAPPNPAVGSPEEGPFLGSEAKTLLRVGVYALVGLLILGLLAAVYAAAELLLPIALAFVLMLVLQPAMRFLETMRVPRALAALAIILLLFFAVAALSTALSGPVSNWAQKLPETIPKLQERLGFLRKPIAAVQGMISDAQALTQGGGAHATTVAVEGSGVSQWLLATMRALLGGLLETVIVLFFLLLSGDTFLRRLVEAVPRFKNKRQLVEIAQQIEGDISAYLLTITFMNAVVGVLTGFVAGVCGLGDPILWGTVSFLLNFVPVLGPTTGVGLFLVAGLFCIDNLWLAMLPAALYLGIHVGEGETLTPLLLARRFTLNPVLVIVSLAFWYWMWGVPGAILATPMLAIAKIICDRTQTLQAVGHLIEG
jgi:predicted PurR-regulated permease PerM